MALAQILYYHRLQPFGEVSYDGKDYRVAERLDHKFDWNLFTHALTKATMPETKAEVALYCYYTAVVCRKDFVAEASYQGNSEVRRAGLAQHYHCTSRRYRNTVEGPVAVRNVIMSELAEKRPLLLYAGAHAFVIDGVRTDATTFEVHLNCGWGGRDNGWYDFDAPFKTSRGLLGDDGGRWVLAVLPPRPGAPTEVK